MKTILLLLILSSALAMPAIGALDDADLDKIRVIVNEANTPIKTDVAWRGRSGGPQAIHGFGQISVKS